MQIRDQTDLRVDFTWAGIYFATRARHQLPVAPGSRGVFLVPEPLRLPELLHSDHQAASREVEPVGHPVRRARARGAPRSTGRSCATAPRGSCRWAGGPRLPRRPRDGAPDAAGHRATGGTRPSSGVGDLLLLRGDMIHRTQDTDTERVALSFRASSSTAIVRRDSLAEGGLYKARMMARNAATSELMFRAFDASGKDELVAHELLAMMRTVTLGQPMTPRQFMRYLLSEKLRAGVLARSSRAWRSGRWRTRSWPSIRSSGGPRRRSRQRAWRGLAAPGWRVRRKAMSAMAERIAQGIGDARDLSCCRRFCPPTRSSPFGRITLRSR